METAAHFSLRNDASQPCLSLKKKKEEKRTEEKERRQKWRPEGLSCEDGLPQKVNIPIIPHCGNIMLQLAPPLSDSSLCRSCFFHIMMHHLWMKHMNMYVFFGVGGLKGAFLWNAGRTQPAVKSITRACNGDDLQRSRAFQPSRCFHRAEMGGREAVHTHEHKLFVLKKMIFGAIVQNFILPQQIKQRLPDRPASPQPVPVLPTEEVFSSRDAERRYERRTETSILDWRTGTIKCVRLASALHHL